MDFEKRIENLKKERARLRKKVECLEEEKKGLDNSNVRFGELLDELIDIRKQSARYHDRLEWLEKVGRMGEWEKTELGVKCPVCGFECDDVYYLSKGKFCPDCGCYMEHGLKED